MSSDVIDSSPIGADWLKARAAASPSAVGLMAGERIYTYGQLDELASRLCVKLLHENVMPG